MEPELSIQILKYIDENTTNFKLIDLIPKFRHILTNHSERFDFLQVLKELKRVGYIKLSSNPVMLIVQRRKELIPYGLHEIDLRAKITIPGQVYLKGINNGALQKKKVNEELTHRETLLIVKYKNVAGYIPYPIPSELKKISTGLYKQYYTVFSPGRSYKDGNAKELMKIIPYLTDFPNAKKAAENDLTKLN